MPAQFDRFEQADGTADAVPSADGRELVPAENVAYLIDDQHRWRAVADLRRRVGLAAEQILVAADAVLHEVVAGTRRRWTNRGGAAGCGSG